MSRLVSARFQKRADAVLDYMVNWTTWLASDTIDTSTWTVPDGLTLDSSTETTTAATAWLSGGTVGTTYEVVNTIVTAGGRTDYRTVTIEVID